MAISTRGVAYIGEVLGAGDQAAPDFSFLSDWSAESGDSFFPRLNTSAEARENLTGDDRKKLRVAVEAVESVAELLDDASMELSESKGTFSNSISVFHRDGEVSIVAIPVTETTERAMGGFLLAADLWSMPNSERFIEDLRGLNSLVEPTEGYLKWRWWPVKKDDRDTNARSAAQLLLSATNPSKRNIHVIADMVENRARFTNGLARPTVDDWRTASTKLESLRDFPSDSVVVTLELSSMSDLQASLRSIQGAFERRDLVSREAQEKLDTLAIARTNAHLNSLPLDAFAAKVKGQGFSRKNLETIFERHAAFSLPAGRHELTIGNLALLARTEPGLFENKSLRYSMGLIETYGDDQLRLLGYPRLSDEDAHMDEFVRKAYSLYRDQTRPYPNRSQVEALSKLLEGDPKELHLVSRSEDAVKRLIGSTDTYQDAKRLEALTETYDEPTTKEARDFFKENPATFQAILSSMGLNALTLEQISGFLAPEITASIRDLELDLSGMKSPLRSYQHFGVQYGFHQKRFILGDEMGLGKTVTALGLVKHLQNNGHNRFLVIVPNAVLENWRRETPKHTDITPLSLHGEDLTKNLKLWIKNGGLAIATFDSIQQVNTSSLVSKITDLDLTIVDEAHYIKNPDTKRAKAVLPWVGAAERAMLMTGTALENRLEEFIQLISYVQPQLPIPEDRSAYSVFRRGIAPAYLRRNQVDVLQELPELIIEKEYIELSAADEEYYRRALQTGDWNLARRAKILAGESSATVQSMLRRIEAAKESGKKVLIFTYYREVIEVLKRVLGDSAPFTPITGDLSSVERQEQVDLFTASEKPGVLLAQIKAGGTGLNIQAASVVMIVERQAKPSLELQAIRRAHRMGQTNPVEVVYYHGVNTIDVRWAAMVDDKMKIYDATAGMSDAQAFDNSVAGEQKSLFEAERKAWGV